jgi:hypothetical protein
MNKLDVSCAAMLLCCSFLQYKTRRTVNYNEEVAFERKPAAGFYDTSEETAMTKAITQVGALP